MRATDRAGFASRLIVLALAVALALAALASSPAGAASDILPDLRMARLTDLKIERAPDGRKLLRFSSIIVNVGDGPMELHGQRPDTATSTMTTAQRIFDEAGEHRDVTTDAVMYFGGDGHNHWHVRDLETFELERLRKSSNVGTGAKHGFCFSDNYRYGSDQDPRYTGCGQAGDLQVAMGLSVGWGDLYRYSLPDQYIDITGLGRGRYRLTGTADAENWFQESDESNNSTWVNIRIRHGKAEVLRFGPAA
jgi:Lysyl oxidase